MIIRPATVADGAAVAAIKVASWRHSYAGIVPVAVLEGLREDDVRERWLGVPQGDFPTSVLMLSGADGAEGYAMFGPVRRRSAGYGYDGQLYEIYLRPSSMGKGYGTELFRAAMDRLSRLGHDGCVLWVFRDNQRGRRFYARLGGTLLQSATVTTVIGDEHLAEVAYGFRPLPVTGANR